jgi:hypothetical protein
MNLALDRWLERYARLQLISQRIRLAGADLCEDRLSPVLGAAVAEMAFFPVALDYGAFRRFGTLEGLGVIEVFPDMAAARSGLKAGDMILAIDGRAVDDLTQLHRPLYGESQPTLEVDRQGERIELVLDRDAGCGFPAEMSLSEAVNAFANKSGMVFTSALVREVQDDAILATVVGHELAHNILEHTLRAGAPIRQEMQADYLGFYLAAMANYQLVDDPELYITVKRDINQVAERTRTHPTGPARTAALRKTIAEISDRRARGLPLEPTR